MLEPFGASVFNTVLSARPLAAKASSSHSTLKILSRVSGSSFPQDFFTPRPRGAKGKERAMMEESLGVIVCTSGQSGCGNIAGSSIGCKRVASGPDAPSYRQRTRLNRRSSQRLAQDSPRIPQLTIPVRCCAISQRRHVSTVPEPPDPPRVFIGNLNGEEWLSHVSRSIREPPTVESMESVWVAYEALRSKQQHNMLSAEEMIMLGNRIVQIQVSHKRKSLEQRNFWELWGNRLLLLLQDVDDRLPQNLFQIQRQNWYRLRGSALALTGQIEEAMDMASFLDALPGEFQLKTYSVHTYNIIIRCIEYYRNAEAVVEFLVDHWDALDVYFNLRTDLPFPKTAERGIRAFRWGSYDAASRVENPIVMLRRLSEKWPKRKYRITGLLLLDALCLKDLPFDALAVMQELEEQDVVIPWQQRFAIVKALAKASVFDLANTLFVTVSQDSTDTSAERELNEMGLYLFARQGDVERVEEYTARLEKRGGIFAGQITQLIHVHAVRSDPVKAVEVFERFFAPQAQGTRRPDITHFTTVIHAFARCGDHIGINVWLEKMVQAGFAPDTYVYNVILQCFVQRGEVASVSAILDQMRASDNRPTMMTYTSVIAMLAERKDSAAAEAIYQRAIGEGIVPTSPMVNALMNAHVEAGSWAGVVTAFNYLKSVARGRGLGITVSTYNTMLKAYILAGAPFQTVLGYFTKMRESSVTPDKYTYALVIQSACDAGLMDAAQELFAEMEKHAADWVSRIRIDDYVLTILMAGYLRQGSKARAKVVYDDMIRRGIQPTSFTFRLILSTYSNPRSLASIAMAEQFLKALLAANAKMPHAAPRSVRAGLDYLYRPLLAAYRSRGSKVDVERLLQNLFDEGGTPTISNLSILLDLYRRRHNIDGARQIWSQIHQLALQDSDIDSLFLEDKSKPQLKRRGNILCIALSIYIDALSAAGQHTEVPLVWRRLAAEGFTFDSHNWNHLVVALVRAGEVERAFKIVERVILPYHQFSQKIISTPDTSPASPLTTDLLTEGTPDPRPPEWPLHRAGRRADTVALLTEKAAKSVPIMNLEDFAHPLSVLHQVTPAWNAWRPHGVVLVLLYKVMKHLQDDRRVHPVQGKAHESSPTATNVDELEQSIKDLQPRAILDRIYANYPRTVKAVLAYRKFFCTLRKERRDYVKYRRQVQKVQRLRTRGIHKQHTGAVNTPDPS